MKPGIGHSLIGGTAPVDIIGEVTKLIDEEVMGKKASHFLYLNAKEKHFIFTMQMRLCDHREAGRPFFCSEKQLNWMKELIDRNQNEDIRDQCRYVILKGYMPYLKRQVANAKSSLKDLEEELASDMKEMAALKKKMFGKRKK